MLQVNFDVRLKFFILQRRLIINFFCQHGHDLILAITVCEAAIRSLKPDWQIDNGFLNRPIIAPTQILVHRQGYISVQNKDFSPGLQMDLTRDLVSSVVHASSKDYIVATDRRQ